MKLQRIAVERVRQRIHHELGQTNSRRFDLVVEQLHPDGHASLARILHALYPDQEKDAALAAFRQFRLVLDKAAAEAKVRLSLQSDGKTRTSPENRLVWFEGDDLAEQEVIRAVRAETAGVDRAPQNAVDPSIRRKVAGYVSCATAERDDAQRLIGLLREHVSASPEFDIELWDRSQVLPGEDEQEEVARRLATSHFALYLESPAYLGDPFVRRWELPGARLLTLIPAQLHRLAQGARRPSHGVPFIDQEGRAFGECTTDKARRAFARALFECIEARLRKPEHGSEILRRHLRAPLGEMDEFVPPHAFPSNLDKLEDAPEETRGERRDALQFLHEWLDDPSGPPYCALLGETGIGKTTTCKALARDLLDRREAGDPQARLPVYLDLRAVGESARREDLGLHAILQRVIQGFWKGGPGGVRLTPDDLIGLVAQQRALVIFDGLDEVLVHLTPVQGQRFTRELYRLLPPEPKPDPNRGRLLISCRSHYFRTLREQKNHLLAEDRDSVGKEYYRALILLPFTEDQIRQYLKLTLPADDPERVLELLRSVHNLRELAERPYTLSLITANLAQVERWKAEGEKITGYKLYDHLVRSWMERDAGKHTVTTDHKRALMEEFAARLWHSGRRLWNVADLEQWLIDFLLEHPRMAAHYEGIHRELLKEDLRTATFLVREGEDGFRFAHTSLLEFFLAGYLRRALREGRPEAWALDRVSRETLDFLGQSMTAEDAQRLEVARDQYLTQATQLAFEYCLLAWKRGYPAPAGTGFQLPGADLRERRIEGAPGNPLALRRINLRGARLHRSQWVWCDLEGADFGEARAYQAEWLDSELGASVWRGATLDAAIFRNSRLERASFEGGRFNGTQWRQCRLEGATGLPPDGRFSQGVRRAQGQGAPPALSVDAGHPGSVTRCAWSPDGQRVASASRDDTVRIWDAGSGECLRILRGHEYWATGCAWSPDGQRVASASEDQTVRIWQVGSGECLLTLRGHQRGVLGCRWSPDGQQVASASWEGTVRIWQAASGECLLTLRGHEHGVNECAWSPDGQRVASASYDQTVRIWDAGSGECLLTLRGHQGWVNGCAWSPDGQRVVSASRDQTVRIWDAGSGECLLTLRGHQRGVLGCGWSPDGQQVASASDDQTARIWEAGSGECLLTLRGHLGGVSGCAWSPDGQRVASASLDRTVRIWEAGSGECLLALGRNGGIVHGCTWSPDGQRVASTSPGRTVRIWEAGSGECLLTLRGHRASVDGCAWSPDGQRVASGSEDKTVRVWEAGSGECVVTLRGHQGWVRGCAWSPDGQRVASASDDQTARIWEAGSGECLLTLRGHQDRVTGCAWSPDGQRVASASPDRTVRIWDAGSGECLLTLRGHEHGVNECAWSPDGQRVASASWDQTVRIWEAENGECLFTLRGHQGGVRGCAWSPDGQRVASASHDRTVRIWDAGSGGGLRILRGHEDGALVCAWSPDGHRLVSSSLDVTLRMWDAHQGEELLRIHTLPGDEWCSADFAANRILACGTDAWRHIRWEVCQPDGSREFLLAEAFGPLPERPTR